MEKTTLSVFVPVYNEEYLVEESLNRLFVLEESAYLKKVQIIVVNDASKDNTDKILARLAKELPEKSFFFEWKFLNHDKNQGKGAAIQTALKEANCDISIIHDADLEYYPKDILRMIPLFVKESADAVYGSRFTVHEHRRVLFYRHELGNRLLTFLSNIVSNLNLTDIETCYKAVRTNLLKSIPIRSNDFRLEPELTIKLAKRQARIFEVPINYCGRTYQEGKKINWCDGFKAIWAIIKFSFSDDIFTEDEYGSRILARLNRADKFNTWMADTIRPYVGQSVLEIGSGIGNITKKLIPRQNYYATDINPLYLQISNNLKVDKPYLKISHLDVTDVSDFKKENRLFDTVICLNVVEHIDDDLSALKNISDLLEQGGTAIVLIPRGKWLFNSLDKVLGHKRRYTKDMIIKLATKADLEINKILPFNRIGVPAWFLNGNILRKKTFSIFQVYLLQLLTPLFRIIDNYLPLPSLSYIAILKKPQKKT